MCVCVCFSGAFCQSFLFSVFYHFLSIARLFTSVPLAREIEPGTVRMLSKAVPDEEILSYLFAAMCVALPDGELFGSCVPS